MSHNHQSPGVIVKSTMVQVVSSGGQCTSQIPKPVIITPAPSNGTSAELQAMTNHDGH